MAEIIKTWPSVVSAKTVAKVFSPSAPAFSRYYFSLGRGKPKQAIERMWFTYGGRILGWFEVEEIVCNDGSIPPLKRLDGGESGWQFKPDVWLAVCAPPCRRIPERLFYEPFRGWRYFDLEAWRGNFDSRHRFG